MATRGIESILTDRRVLDWGDKIMKLGIDVAPFLVISRALSKEPAKNQVFISFEDQPYTRWIFVNTAGTLDGTTVDTSFSLAAAGAGGDAGGFLNVGDLIWDKTQNGYLWLTKVTRGAPDTFAVVKDYSGKGIANMALSTQSGKTFDTSDTTADTAIAPAQSDVCVKVSNTWEDGGLSADPIALNLEKSFNFIQKFKSSYNVDRETMLSELNGEPELKRLQARKAVEHLKDLEWQFILGKKDARVYAGARTGSTGKYIYTTGGLYFSGMNEDTVETLTETAARSFFRAALRPDRGPREKLLIAGGLLVEGIDVWSVGRLVTKEGVKKTGLHIVQYKMAGGLIDILPHPLLEDELEGVGFLMDMSVLKQKVFDDTKLSTGIQANDAEERLDQYITQVGLKLGLLEHHRMISGIAEIGG